ncbi:MAG: Glu/Leu/Phe/Val dehydrogenase dimerization domain-containing protein [Saprospiraceae bacterium]
MTSILDQYLSSEPEIVFEWQDSLTSAHGWVVINSLKNGAAGGGTRMRKGLTKEEVISLSKVMGIKFAVCGPAIGGAKSGINFDPEDPRKGEVLTRWFKAIRPILKEYYGTGGDLNVDEVKDVFPITEALGILHPQEGVLNGYFAYSDTKKKAILAQLDKGCKLPVMSEEYSVDRKGRYNIADMITGFGVAESVKHFYSIHKSTSLKGKKCLIQGWGNVASSAAFYLAKEGAIICGIIDKEFSIYDSQGIDYKEIIQLFLNKNGNQLNAPRMQANVKVLDQIWKESFEIFIPAASSHINTLDQLNQLIANGLQLVSCGANVPFIEDKIVFGDTSQSIDSRISLIPDFIANCGMARTFNYLMKEESEISEIGIFTDVSNLIKDCIVRIKEHSDSEKNIMHSALFIYLK